MLKPYSAPIAWFEHKPGLPNKQEMLFLTGLVTVSGPLVSTLNKWADLALLEETAYAQPGWVMPEAWKQVGAKASVIFEPLEYAYNNVRDADRLEQIGKMMQAWRGDGRMNELTVDRLRKHFTSGVLGPPSHPKKPNGGPPRWRTPAAALGVAALYKRHGVELRKLLKIEEQYAPRAPARACRSATSTSSSRACSTSRACSRRRRRRASTERCAARPRAIPAHARCHCRPHAPAGDSSLSIATRALSCCMRIAALTSALAPPP